MTANTAGNQRLSARIGILLFATAFIVHLFLSGIGWDHTLLGPHSFRQVQTSISTYYFLQDGISLNYQTPILGPPWEIPLELPLFQACTAGLVRISGLELDLAGRLVSWIFFISALPACYLLLGALKVSAPHRLVILSGIILSPLYIFFSRSFLIESSALSLSLWFLVCFERYLRKPRFYWGILAVAIGATAGAVKVTTFAIFLIAAAAFFWRRRNSSDRTSRFSLWTRTSLVLGLTVIFTVAWVFHATVVRDRNLNAAFLDTHFGFWSFGDIAQRLSLPFWGRTFRVWAGDIVNEGGILLLVLYYALLRGRFRREISACLIIFLSGQLIFSNLYFIHAYYFYANGLFLLAAVGLALVELLENETFPFVGRWAVVVAVIALQGNAYVRSYWDFQRTNRPIPEEVRVVSSISQPDDIIVVVGHDWDAWLPYYAERRALMIPKWKQADFPAIRQSLARLDPAKVAAVIISRDRWSDGDYVEQAFGPLNLGRTPLLWIQDLGIWVPRSRQAEIRDAYDARRFPSFSLSPNELDTGESRTLLARQILRRSTFNSFSPRPVRATAMNEFSVATVNHMEVVSANVPTEYVFRPSRPTRSIHAVYGISDAAYEGQARTDGVEFLVKARAPNHAEEVVFRRFLNPLSSFGDRGMQQLDLVVDRPAGTEFSFETLPGPSGNRAFDWSYWGAITLR